MRNNDENLVFQDKIEIFFFISCGSRRERESLSFNLVVRDEIDILKISSCGEARKNGPDDGLGKSLGQ